jgi:cytochrome P450
VGSGVSLAWKDLPGPPALPLLGHLLGFRRDILTFIMAARKEGAVARFQAGPARCVLLSDPALVWQALTVKASSFEREDALRTVARYLLGQGMVTSDGEEHARQRALGKPAMAAARMPDYLPAMDELAEKLAERWKDSGELELCEGMAEYALRVATVALFGRDLGEEAGPFAAAAERCMDAMQPVPTFPPQGWWLWLSPQFRRDRALILSTVESLLEGRRKSAQGGLFADMVLAAEAGGQSRERSREIALSVMVAGSETTAMALTWALYLVASHPEVQAGLRNDEGGVFASGVVHEALRMYPPVWMLGRRACEDVDLGGLRLKKGELLYMSQYLIHRDPRFYPEPEIFKPGRWTAGFKADLPPGAWLPFGAGPRGCFGEAFAMNELMAAFRIFTRNFEWSLRPGDGVPALKPFITLRPRGGLRLQIRGLNSSPSSGGQHGSSGR